MLEQMWAIVAWAAPLFAIAIAIVVPIAMFWEFKHRRKLDRYYSMKEEERGGVPTRIDARPGIIA